MQNEHTTEELIIQISELKSQIKGLEKDLIHDSLTELKTRAFFEEESKVYLELITTPVHEGRKEWFGFKHLSFLFLDVDHFKSVNDTYGHDVGDVVLRKVAHTVHSALREGDTAARWGGEEMVVSLLGANEDDALHTAERINELVSKLTFSEAPDLCVTISIGIATAELGLSFEDMIKRADSALYAAKEGGRNIVVRYSELSK